MKPLKLQNVYEKKKWLYTKNAYPGTRHFEERLEEGFREWNPERSKLGAAIKKGISQTGVREGSVVLYLGAGHGYTPSYVSDIVGKKGMVFCVEFSPRVVQDLLGVCQERDNMAPIMGDANKPEQYKGLVPEEVDVVFQDVAQKNQVEIFLKNCDEYLKKGGFGLLALKSRSFDVTKKPQEVFKQVRRELEQKMTVVDYRDLHPLEKDHALFVCKK